MRKKQRQKPERRDFREFAFRATGCHTDPKNVTRLDLHDNLREELIRLRSVAITMRAVDEDLDSETVGGLSLLLLDIQERMDLVLREAKPRIP